jgi:type 1 glutamine amidotransferase
MRTVLLLAGEPSSKPGQHEYIADCTLLAGWLRQAAPSLVPQVAHTWPTNGTFPSVTCIVVAMDGGAKHPLIEESRWKKLREWPAQGVGLVVLHQSVDFPKTHADEAKQLIGGVWLADIGCRGHWDMDLKPVGEHPVLRGVKPFAAKGDGWLYNLHFADKGFTPLLVGKVPDSSRTTADAKQHKGRDEVIAWAYERVNGARAFCFTGVDLHKNWELESQRKLVVNGILWAAKMEVPSAGAKVELQPGDLERDVRRAESPAAK